MKCTCSKWIEKVPKGQKVHIAGEAITNCPFCGLQLIKDGFRVLITYDGPADSSKENDILVALSSFNVLKSPGKKKLYFDIPTQ